MEYISGACRARFEAEKIRLRTWTAGAVPGVMGCCVPNTWGSESHRGTVGEVWFSVRTIAPTVADGASRTSTEIVVWML